MVEAVASVLDEIIAAAVPVGECVACSSWPGALRALFSPRAAAWHGAPLRIGEIADADTIAAFSLDAASPWPLHAVFALLLTRPAMALERVLRATRVRIAPSARRALLLQLVRRWSALGAPVLMHRLTVSDVLAMHPGHVDEHICHVFFGTAAPSRTQWLTFFRHFPVLARLMAVAAEQWIDGLSEMLSRLETDAALLAEKLDAGPAVGALRSVTTDLGETHDGGRAVAILRFSQGPPVVYKPHDLRVAEAYFGIVRHLNATKGGPTLHERQVLARDGYAWEEFVSARCCATLADVRRYYQRMGAHARLLQLFGATDFTTDNVLVCGDHPVLVDLETLITPITRIELGPPGVERRANRIARRIPMHSGLVTARIEGERDREVADLGALAGRSRWTAPFRQAALRRDEHGVPHLADDYLEFSGNSAAPRLHGVEVDPAAHRADVVAGYVMMDGLLARAAGGLLASPHLAQLVTAPVRYICRDTHIYTRLLAESLRPGRLRDASAWEQSLARVRRAPFPDARVNEAELGALRRLDVPSFHAQPGSDALILADGSRIDGYFASPPLRRVRAELGRLAARGERHAADDIRTALFLLAPDEQTPGPPHRGLPQSNTSHQEIDWRREAAAIGDSLLDLAVRDRRGNLGWAGVNYTPDRDRWSAGPLVPHLLTGTAGLAMVFAALYRVTGIDRFGDAARAVIRTLTHRLERTLGLDRRLASLHAGEGASCGAFHGWGGWWYAWHRGAQLLGDASLARKARAMLGAAVHDSRVACRTSGVVCGAAGLALAVTGYAGAADPEMASVAAALLPSLDGAAPSRQARDCPGSTSVLEHLPVRPTAERLARLRLEVSARRAGGSCDTSSPAFGEPNRRRPSAGEVLAQLDTARWTNAQIATTVGRSVAWVRHGLRAGADPLDIAEVAVRAAEVGDSASPLVFAEQALAGLVQTHRASGSWRPDRLAADRHYLCALGGTGAVAYACLRLCAPGIVPSLRLLA